MVVKFLFKKLILCFFCFPVLTLLGQKKFYVTITFPKEFEVEKLEAYLDNGKRLERIKAIPQTNNKVLFKGEYYSLYAMLELQYKRDSSETADIFGNWFFLQEKPAAINFSQSDLYESPFEKYSLQNAWDFKSERQQIAIFDSVDRRVALEFEERYLDKIDSGNDTVISNYYFNVLRKTLGRKRLEYILKNSKSYYSFYRFRTDVAWPLILPADSLVGIFNTVFPDNFKFSDEGNYLNDFLHGRMSKREESNSIDFAAKDVNGKSVVLSQFRNQKNVLLHFWATWCSPCMEELPVLKEIINQYNQEDLQIISIAFKSPTYKDFVKTTSKYNMNWINIYNDVDLINKFGNYPVPRICVIDKTGKMIYDSSVLEKREDSQLSQLKQALRTLMK